jgi:predicted HTH transcriptional regulator
MIRIPLHTTADLDQLHESFELECKLAAGRDGKGELPHDFWRSYSAMANTNGGVILLGVKEKDGKFSFNSIQKPEKVLKELFLNAHPTIYQKICMMLRMVGRKLFATSILKKC